MAEHYRFFGGTPEDPRQYNQTEFAEVLERIFKNGIFPNVGSELKVEPTDPPRMAVRVAPGQAWIKGYWYKNDDWKEIGLPPADPTYPRIHRIVLRLDTVDQRKIMATVKVGTPQAVPSVPELERNDQFWELSLATVFVAAGVTSVNTGDITDDRYSESCCGVAVPRDAATQKDFDAHTAATTSVHGATSAATPNTIVQRDPSGRAKVAAPSAADDIARKDTVDAVQTNLTNHINATTGVHGATSAATPNTIVQRDSAGRFKAAAPSASDDVARKADVDAHASRTDNPHGVTKSQVGLGNVQNYGIASQAQAQAGTDNASYMTPLRTKQAIDQFVPIETGSWTPDLRFGGSNAGITYALRAGRYTRIANVVYWSFTISLISKGSASGAATIAGLPFNSTGLNFWHAVGHADYISVPSGQWLSSHVLGATVYLITNTGSALTSAEFSNASTIGASGFYFI